MEGLATHLQTLFGRIQPRFYLPIILASLGLLCIGYSLIYFLVPHGSRENFRLDEFSQASSSAKLTAQQLTVDVEGAVLKPGVYTVTVDARLQDALVAAGGMSSSADREWVAKHINLAQKISDGAKIYIPVTGDTQAVAGASDTSTGDVSTSANAQVNINTASADQLDSLPGIGQVTAGKIINGRPYTDINELVSRKIVTQKVFDKIKASITVF